MRGLGTAAARRYNRQVEFRILGPLEVRDGDVAISFDAPKHRALLGVLLLHPNEVVSTERLIDELWGERPPSTAGKVLQTYVSQLRKAIGSERIVTHAPGYLLRLDGDALDAVHFRRLAGDARALAADGDAAEADRRYREALGLWRGPPLADVLFESFARNEVERLGEERVVAVMDRIDCDLALGGHDALVPELEALVRQYPLRERLRAQLMLALYRSGRQADALTAYRDARRTLDEELGLEPSRELQDLERSILNHDAALERPTRPSTSRPVKQRIRGRRAVALAALILLAVASGVAFALDGDAPRSRLLAANSIGYVDAESGRVTGSFPVGRRPRAIAVTNDSVWVANHADQTVTRVDRRTGETVTIVVGGHPSALAVHRGTTWVWTTEGFLVPIDPRFDRAGEPRSLAAEVPGLAGRIEGVAPTAPQRREGGGRMTSGGDSLWITIPLTTLIRMREVRSGRAEVILPDAGVHAPIRYHDGEAWVAGYGSVFRIDADTGIPGSGIRVGLTRDFTFGHGSMWVVSGGQMDHQIGVALRRIDPVGGVVEETVDVGDPVAVASAGDSIWVASRNERALLRVDPRENRVVDTIPLGAPPRALAADAEGVWVAVGD